MSSSKGIMETQPGGESTQYESIPPTINTDASRAGKDLSQGQLGQSETTDSSTTVPADHHLQRENEARGAKTADNIRYGQAISESGVAGMTQGVVEGVGSQDTGYGSTKAKESLTEDARTRSQGEESRGSRAVGGYDGGEGEGNDVGA